MPLNPFSRRPEAESSSPVEAATVSQPTTHHVPNNPAAQDFSASRWPACDTCGVKQEKLFIDPIPTVDVDPRNPGNRRQYEKSLCGGCFSKRYQERFGTSPKGIPD